MKSYGMNRYPIIAMPLRTRKTTSKPVSAAARRRRAEFKAAVAIARITIQQWCEDAGVSAPHLYQVLTETRESAPLLEKVDAFIAKHLPDRVRQSA